MTSLLIDCQNCFEKGHESWKSYFSKWEILAKQEEEIPESELNEGWDEDSSAQERLRKKKIKKQPLSKRKPTLLTKKGKERVRKCSRKLIRKKKTPAKTEQKLKTQVIEQSKNMDNGNIEEKTDSALLEMNLRAILMNILKANKSKWEIFSVLSQTFSQGESAVKGSHPPLQNQHLALTSNDVISDNMSFSFRSQRVFSVAEPRYNLTNGTTFECADSQRVCSTKSLEPVRNGIYTRLGTQNRFIFNFNRHQLSLLQSSVYTPQPSSKIVMESRILKSCPSSFPNYPHYRRNVLRPQALEFGSKTPALEYNKIINSERIRNDYDQPLAKSTPEVNRSWKEKSSRDSGSCKGTNDICLNMENSNFITPERKPSKRKCFGENISQRKRTRSSKLFFDNEDEDSESDDQTETRSPLIRWKDKNLKSLLTPEVVDVESDSDESENILDRIKKP